MAAGFAELPARIAALTREHERVAVVLLDAFGWKFLQRHADHPFLKRLEIEPVASQFPSTTTAHLTTLYTGLPVARHGLYEWQVYEPAVDGIVYDTDRVMFLRSCLTQLQRATADGVPVRGYFLWSTMDNFEWTDGYGTRFGLVHVDFATQKRTPKMSAAWFREAAQRNAVV